MKHKCPYLRNHKYCDYKGHRGICMHKDCTKCELLTQSRSKAKVRSQSLKTPTNNKGIEV